MQPLSQNDRLMRLLQANSDDLTAIDRILTGQKSVTTGEGNTPPLTTIREAAAYLSCSRATIYRLVQAGKLRCTHLLNRSPRIHRSDLEVIASGREV